ncbi:MAG TPA: hypothetical protein VIR02_15010 [Anaerolineales bacterium]
MKTRIYTLAFVSLALFTSSCGDEEAPFPSDYTNVGVPTDDINRTIVGQWKKYVITQTTYTNDKETTQTIASYTGDYRFEDPASTWDGLIVYNFPHTGMFEVTRYGERLAFFQRANKQHINMFLSEVSPTKIVFKEHQVYGEDHFIVISHTLTK